MDCIDLAEDGDQEEYCEHGDELLGSIKYWEFLEWLSNWRLLKKCLSPWR
jgi:hypothetical protein